MRRLLIALALLTVASRGHAASLTPTEAAQHVGERITLEGDVAAARVEGDTCVLEFAGTDPALFRAVLLIPMISSLPARPDRLYDGHRVRIDGTVRRFRGRVEMVLQSPGQIEVVDHAGAPVETTTTSTTTTTHPPRAHTPPAPVAPPPTLPPLPPSPPAPVAPTTTTLPTPRIDPCPGATQRWRDARDAVRTAMRTLDDCLSGTRPNCRREAAALAPALSSLEWSEQAVSEACP